MSSYMHFRDGKVAGWSVPLTAIGTAIGVVVIALVMLPIWAKIAVGLTVGGFLACFALAYGYDRYAARRNAEVEEELAAQREEQRKARQLADVIAESERLRAEANRR